mmetsp:Transcript_33337/g.59701  ORF Transcript_33337/g.59701 Transcript_33337/m.59701 type:complete len:266 (+) Transcript_33337:2596-3393(+)
MGPRACCALGTAIATDTARATVASAGLAPASATMASGERRAPNCALAWTRGSPATDMAYAILPPAPAAASQAAVSASGTQGRSAPRAFATIMVPAAALSASPPTETSATATASASMGREATGPVRVIPGSWVTAARGSAPVVPTTGMTAGMISSSVGTTPRAAPLTSAPASATPAPPKDTGHWMTNTFRASNATLAGRVQRAPSSARLLSSPSCAPTTSQPGTRSTLRTRRSPPAWWMPPAAPRTRSAPPPTSGAPTVKRTARGW